MLCTSVRSRPWHLEGQFLWNYKVCSLVSQTMPPHPEHQYNMAQIDLDMTPRNLVQKWPFPTSSFHSSNNLFLKLYIYTILSLLFNHDSKRTGECQAFLGYEWVSRIRLIWPFTTCVVLSIYAVDRYMLWFFGQDFTPSENSDSPGFQSSII